MVAFETLLPDDPIAIDLTALYTRFHPLTNQCARRGRRYPLLLLLTVAVLAKLTGHHQVREVAEWAALRAQELAHVFQLSRATMPHWVTWSRVLGSAVDVPALEQVLRDIVQPPTG